ncbi:MAG: sigma-54 dependent transcriptional regulator [Bacteroidota bacterium]
MSDQASILVVDDDKAFRVATKTLLEDEGFVVATAASGDEALTKMETEQFDLVLSDMVMGKMSGVELLANVKAKRPDLPVIMVTGFGSIQTAVEAMRLGASDYLTKPSNNDELLIKIRRALEMQDKERQLRSLREELQGTYSFGNMVSRSPVMQEVIRQVQQVADTDVTILIQGESGTGKELVARALHFNSKRSLKPFVVVNCSAIPENLLESELFGYERGAFTGATRQRAGKFEEANNGTLFLDEIGDISPAVQTKLLRALQDKTFERVGGTGSISVNTRVVAATNRNLDVMVRQGDFREDLFYRLNVFPIVLPPLRERLEDIPLLTEHFLHRHADLAGGTVKSVATAVISDMMNYTWRGNIRELENLIKRAIIKTPGEVITSLELPNVEPAAPSSGEPAEGVNLNTPYKDYIGSIIRHAEERYLVRMLRLCKGNINQVAKLMDVDRKTIYRKMSDYSIDPASFRE